MSEEGLVGATAESKSYLMEALAKAQERARAVVKDGDDPRYGKGTLASTETIIQVVKSANTGLGISFRPKECPIIRDAAGGIIALKRVLIVAHTSGEFFEVSTEWPVVLKTNRDGKASQTWDDAIATAQTRSLGYLLRDTWGLPRLKEEDMPPGAGDGPATDAEPTVSPWEAQRTRWNGIARAAIKAGTLSKRSIIEEARRLGASLDDDGVWTGEPSPAAAQKLDPFFARIANSLEKPENNAPNGESKSSSTPSAGSPTSPPVSPPATSSSPSTASKSTQASSSGPASTASPSTPAATPAERVLFVPREKLDALSDAITTAIKTYGTVKKDMVLNLRKWSGSELFVTDGGQFSKEITPDTWKRAVAGFKAWEADEIAKREAAKAGKSPEQVAEEAASEWEAATEGSAPQ